jgi:hypothetical protein
MFAATPELFVTELAERLTGDPPEHELPVTLSTTWAVAGLICRVELLPTLKQLML